jgi:hypothetical protein
MNSHLGALASESIKEFAFSADSAPKWKIILHFDGYFTTRVGKLRAQRLKPLNTPVFLSASHSMINITCEQNYLGNDIISISILHTATSN